MTAATVIPALDIAEDLVARLGRGCELTAMGELALDRCKEALRHRVIVGIPRRTHRDAHPVRRTQPPEILTAVLHTVIAMMNQPRPWTAPQRHPQRLHH